MATDEDFRVPKEWKSDPMANDIDQLFNQAVQEWIEQGRDPEHVYAIKNFMSGRTIKLKKDLVAYTTNKEQEARKVPMDLAVQFSTELDKHWNSGDVHRLPEGTIKRLTAIQQKLLAEFRKGQ